MTASAARRELGRVAALSASPATRGERFLRARSGARPPGFAALLAAPRWPVLDDAGRELVAMAALLIAGRSALARMIDGARLRAYAALVGDAVLEAVLAHDGGDQEPLPPADGLAGAARALLDLAARQDGAAAARLHRAEHFLKDAGAWPSI